MDTVTSTDAAAPAAAPEVTRTVTDFVVAYLDRIAVAIGSIQSLHEAANVVQGPGAAQLRAALEPGYEWEQLRQRLSELAAAWRTPVLESFAVALGGGSGPVGPMRDYLLACATAEAVAALPRPSAPEPELTDACETPGSSL